MPAHISNIISTISMFLVTIINKFKIVCFTSLNEHVMYLGLANETRCTITLFSKKKNMKRVWDADDASNIVNE